MLHREGEGLDQGRREAHVKQSKMAEERHSYDAIDKTSRDIRILSLLPGEFNDPIECLVHNASIDEDGLNYETLSYVWGDSAIRTSILVNGQSTEVTTNLGNALRYLRKKDEPLSIWADALCINQHNPSEKTHQIGLMGQIYRRSSNVNIWLGCDDNAGGQGDDSNSDIGKPLRPPISDSLFCSVLRQYFDYLEDIISCLKASSCEQPDIQILEVPKYLMHQYDFPRPSSALLADTLKLQTLSLSFTTSSRTNTSMSFPTWSMTLKRIDIGTAPGKIILYGMDFPTSQTAHGGHEYG